MEISGNCSNGSIQKLQQKPWPRGNSSDCLSQGRLPEEVAFELGPEGWAAMFKVSKPGKGISEAALRSKRRQLKEYTGVKRGRRSEKAGWGGRSREGKAVIPQGLELLRKKV